MGWFRSGTSDTFFTQWSDHRFGHVYLRNYGKAQRCDVEPCKSFGSGPLYFFGPCHCRERPRVVCFANLPHQWTLRHFNRNFGLGKYVGDALSFFCFHLLGDDCTQQLQLVFGCAYAIRLYTQQRRTCWRFIASTVCPFCLHTPVA